MNSLLHSILYTLYLTLVPVLIMQLERRWKWIARISPMTVLYLIGLLLANSTHFTDPTAVGDINKIVYSVAVPLAIPLMLMSCNLHSYSMGSALKVFISGLFSVIIMCVVGYFIFRHHGAERFAQVAAVTTGMYTGGMPNVGAIAQGVHLSDELYLYITSYDLIVTGCYLVFVIFAGKAVFRRLLPPDHIPTDTFALENRASITYSRRWVWHQMALPSLLTLVIVAISATIAWLCNGREGMHMTVLILTLTTLAIGASLLKPIRKINEEGTATAGQPLSFNAGLYFVYLFCFCIASSCDIRQMDLGGSLDILGFLALVIFGSLALQVLLAKLLHIDGDSVLATSISLINSPPFVPMVAALLGNKNIIVLGITVGLLGYMLGNYMGIGIYHLLQLF